MYGTILLDQGYMNKLIIVSIVMYVLKQSGMEWKFMQSEINSFKRLVYSIAHGIEQCRGQWPQVNKIEI